MLKNKSTFFFIATIFIQIITLAVLIDEKWMKEITKEEVAMMDNIYSEKVTNDVIVRGNHWYMSYIVETSIESHFYDILLPVQYQQTGEIKDDRIGTWIFQTTEKRINAFLEQLRFSFVRFASMLVWLELVGLMTIGFFISAMIIRQKKKVTYDFTSHTRQEYAKRIIIFIPLICWLAFWYPLAVSPWCYPAFGFIVALSISLFLSNSSKRI